MKAIVLPNLVHLLSRVNRDLESEISFLAMVCCMILMEDLINLQHVRLAGLVRCWIVKKYCWLVWCERKILFRLKIYDRLRPSEQAANYQLVLCCLPS